MNAAVALWALWLFRHELRRRRPCAGLRLVLPRCWRGWRGRAHHTLAEDKFYQDRIV
jgi:spermidine synthase